MTKRVFTAADLASDEFEVPEDDFLLKAEDPDEEEEEEAEGEAEEEAEEEREKRPGKMSAKSEDPEGASADKISVDELSKSLDDLVAAARGDALRKGKKGKKALMDQLAGYLKEDLDAEDLQRVKGIVGDLGDGVGGASHATVDKTGNPGEKNTYPAGGQFRGAGKSAFGDDPDIEKAVDVSPFLASLVEQTEGAIDRLAGRLEKGFGVQQDFNEELAKGLRGLGRLIASQQEQIDEMAKALDAPQPGKAATRLSQVRKSERAFGQPGAGGEDGEQLTKAGILDRLTAKYEEICKSEGPTSATAEALMHGVAKYEATGLLSREHARLVGIQTN